LAVLVIASDEIIGRPFIFEPLKGNEANLGATFGEFLAKTEDKNSLMILLPDSYNGNPQPLLASMAKQSGLSSGDWRRLDGKRRGGRDLSALRR
jgi:hypothetical protein